jgi:hypothetical protein
VRTREWDGHEIVDAGSGDFVGAIYTGPPPQIKESIPADIGQAVLDLAQAVDRLAQAVESKDEWFPVNAGPLPLPDTDAEADNKAYLNDEIGQEGRP